MTLKSRKHQRVNVKLENQFTKLEFFPLLNLICKCWTKINLTNLINSEFSDICQWKRNFYSITLLEI